MVPEGAAAVAGQLVHDGQPVCLGGAARPCGLECLEVALGGVHDVADDVADLPLGACGGSFPGAGRLGHREHAFRLIAYDLEDGFFPLVGHGVPRAHMWFLSWLSVPAARGP